MRETGEKKQIRLQISRQRAALSTLEKERMDADIRCRLLENMELFLHGIYCYASFQGEVDTWELMQGFWEKHIPVALPRIENREIRFYQTTCREDLCPGFRGILEPAHWCVPADNLSSPVITPGVAFSLAGERVGYGGGYYDRFFRREPEHLRIAVAYPFQIQKQLPSDELDERIHWIVGCDGIYKTAAGDHIERTTRED